MAKQTKKPKAAASQAPANLHNLAIASIAESKSNPRTQFDQAAIDELAESIASVGIIQPIVVRPDADGFEIVCGARRYRAAKKAGLEEVPAIIRELTDEEAFDLAITENLQRKDVNPMDEAVAMLRMKERGYSTKEQAAKLGKSESYVAQRLKLNDLIEPLKDAMFSGKLLISQANQLARISSADQQHILENTRLKNWQADDYDPRTFHIENSIERLQQKLEEAIFDTESTELLADVGSCATCPKNTACSTLLFPELHSEGGRCTDSSCWNKKEAAHLVIALETVKANPQTHVLVSMYGKSSTTPPDSMLKAAKTAGVNLNNFWDREMYRHFAKPHEPSAPDKENYEIDPNDEWPEYDSQEEADAAYAEALKEYDEEMVEYHQKLEEYKETLSKASYIHGLVIEGTDFGRFIPVIPRAATPGSTLNAELITSDTVDVEMEIAAIEAREKRAKELDAEKIHAQLVELFAKDEALSPDSYQTQGNFQHEFNKVLAYILYDNISYTDKNEVYAFLGLTRYTDGAEGVWKTICNFVPEYMPTVINYLLHKVTMGKWQNHLPTSIGGKVLRHLIEQHFDRSTIADVEAQFADKAAKRQANVAAKIQQLKSQQ